MGKKSKNIKTIIIAIIVGFAVAMLIMAIAIYFGYTNAYAIGDVPLGTQMNGREKIIKKTNFDKYYKIKVIYYNEI